MGGNLDREVVIIRQGRTDTVYVGEAYRLLPKIVKAIAEIMAEEYVKANK